MSGSEEKSEQEHKQQHFFVSTYDISSIKGVTRKFNAVVEQQQRYRKVQKSVKNEQSCYF